MKKPDSILMIGCGNDMRGDDGLGPYLATQLGARNLLHVRTVVVHQLLPELADELAEASVVLFADGRVGSSSIAVQISKIGPKDSTTLFSHQANCAGLLALTQRIYNRVPEAWLVSIEGKNFEPGESLSESAKKNSQIAFEMILAFLESVSVHA